MDITKALEQRNGKAEREGGGCANMYAMENDSGTLLWYHKGNDTSCAGVSLEKTLDSKWQPYNPTPQIVPEKAGELWQLGTVFYFTCFDNKGDLQFVDHMSAEWLLSGFQNDPIHGVNGWTRLFPVVEDEVERIEIEGVEWQSAEGVVFTYTNEQVFDWEILPGKPPMKMILEIPK